MGVGTFHKLTSELEKIKMVHFCESFFNAKKCKFRLYGLGTDMQNIFDTPETSFRSFNYFYFWKVMLQKSTYYKLVI